MDCGKANDRCATTGLVFTSSQETTKMFTKVCSTKTACDNSGTVFLKACQAVTGKMCEYKCCDKDLCNNVNNVNNDNNVNSVHKQCQQCQQWRRAHGQHSPDGGLYRSGIFPLKRARMYNNQEKLLSFQAFCGKF